MLKPKCIPRDDKSDVMWQSRQSEVWLLALWDCCEDELCVVYSGCTALSCSCSPLSLKCSTPGGETMTTTVWWRVPAVPSVATNRWAARLGNVAIMRRQPWLAGSCLPWVTKLLATHLVKMLSSHDDSLVSYENAFTLTYAQACTRAYTPFSVSLSHTHKL